MILKIQNRPTGRGEGTTFFVELLAKQ